MSQAAARAMRETGGGVILHNASIDASGGDGPFAAYNAAKAGLLGLNRTMALELAQYGIRSNCVSPGFTHTAMTESAVGPKLMEYLNGNFDRVHLAGGFRDRNLPHGFAPFNIQNIGGKLYVSYAKQDSAASDEVAGAGLGFVDVYSRRGFLLHRVASRGGLNAPWGLVQAPAGFGRFGHALLVGNFGDGKINAYNIHTGHWLGQLRRPNGHPVQIDGLWGLRFGNGVTGDPKTLLFSAGIDDEAHGLFGAIRAH